jgi:hypothetical protein
MIPGIPRTIRPRAPCLAVLALGLAGALLAAAQPAPLPGVGAAPTSAVPGGDPRRHAAEMRREGASANEVAGSLERTYRLEATEVATVLREVGYSAPEIIGALGEGRVLEAPTVVGLLLRAGFDDGGVGAGLRATNLAADDVASALGQAGLDASRAVRVLQGARIPAVEIAAGVIRSFPDPREATTALRLEGLVPAEVIRGSLRAGSSERAVAEAALSGSGSPRDALMALRRAVAEEARATGNLVDATPLVAVAARIVEASGLDASRAEAVLREAGYTGEEITGILPDR